MGVSALYCCFRGLKPLYLTVVGIAASVLSFAFLIWGVADLEYKRKGVEAIYIIAFILVILCMLAFIALFIFLLLPPGPGSRTLYNVGRIICLVILIMCVVALIFMLVAFIILIVDYANYRLFLKGKKLNDNPSKYEWGEKLSKNLSESGISIKSHEWAAIFVPSIISFISLVLMGLIANVLYEVFYNLMNGTSTAVNITQNTNPSFPNIHQPEIIPNNNGPVPPMVNYAPYPVTIQQSGVNLNK